MTPTEIPTFLARLHLLDNRQIDQATASHWHELLEPYTLTECLAALRTHATTSTDYLLPAHIVALVKTARKDAIMRAEIENPVSAPAPKPPELRAHVRSLAPTRRLRP